MTSTILIRFLPAFPLACISICFTKTPSAFGPSIPHLVDYIMDVTKRTSISWEGGGWPRGQKEAANVRRGHDPSSAMTCSCVQSLWSEWRGLLFGNGTEPSILVANSDNRRCLPAPFASPLKRKPKSGFHLLGAIYDVYAEGEE